MPYFGDQYFGGQPFDFEYEPYFVESSTNDQGYSDQRQVTLSSNQGYPNANHQYPDQGQYYNVSSPAGAIQNQHAHAHNSYRPPQNPSQSLQFDFQQQYQPQISAHQPQVHVPPSPNQSFQAYQVSQQNQPQHVMQGYQQSYPSRMQQAQLHQAPHHTPQPMLPSSSLPNQRQSSMQPSEHVPTPHRQMQPQKQTVAPAQDENRSWTGHKPSPASQEFGNESTNQRAQRIDQTSSQAMRISSQSTPSHNAAGKNSYQPPPRPQVIVPPSPSQKSYPSHTLQQQQTPPQYTPIKQVNGGSQGAFNDVQPAINQPHKPPEKKEPFAEPLSVRDPSILLTLADEYLDASKKLEQRTTDYYRLVSTALGCMEATLRNYKLAPLREAQLCLKYAQCLYDETNNLDEAEATLVKSIDLCDRMGFIDLKYAMELLATRVLYRSKPKAAIRDMHSKIREIETYKHTAWEYAFRLQAVTFNMQLSPPDIHDSIQQIEAVQQTSRKHGDNSVYAFAALMECCLHLHNNTADGNDHAQSALARARSLQLNVDVQGNTHLPAAMEIFDIVWALNSNLADEDQMEKKRKSVTEIVSQSIDDLKNWTTDELLWLPLNESSLNGVHTQDGGLIQQKNGKFWLTLSWMGRLELEAIAWLCKGRAKSHLNHHQHGKVEKLMNEGYRIPDEEIPCTDDDSKEPKPIRIKDASLLTRSHILAAHFRAEVAIMSFDRGQLKKAESSITAIDLHVRQIGEAAPQELKALLRYLKGCLEQSRGNLVEAVNHFRSEILTLEQRQPNSKHPQTNKALLHIQLLAAMNTALIIRSPTHPQHQHLTALMESISSHISTTTPKLIAAAYDFVLASLPSTTILQVKQLLSTSMKLSRALKYHQLTGFTLVMIQEKFFRGGVQNSQAVKSARAATHQVRVWWGNPLWLAVAEEMEMESLTLLQDVSKNEEISKKSEEAKTAWAMIPEKVQKQMMMA